MLEQTVFIDSLLRKCEAYKDKLFIIMVTNVKGITETKDDHPDTSYESEYYSLEQHNDIRRAIHKLGIDVKSYFDENDFIHDFLTQVIRNHYPKDILVISTAQKGRSTGRHCLLPTFCEMNHIMHTSSDPQTILFLRNKNQWHKYFQNYTKHVCPSWHYSAESGWFFQDKPSVGTKIIVKLAHEASSIGLSNKNVFVYENDNFIDKLAHSYNTDLIIEKFIEGKEVEVPILKSNQDILVLSPAGISVKNEHDLGDIILNYDIRGNHDFNYYDFQKEYPELSEKIRIVTKELAKHSGIHGLARFDYRIQDDQTFYLTDIATNPHITKSMTFFYNYKNMNYEYSDIIKTLIALAVSKYE